VIEATVAPEHPATGECHAWKAGHLIPMVTDRDQRPDSVEDAPRIAHTLTVALRTAVVDVPRR
jgi:hypothetical protein